jgi:Amt family ammonium transporter
VDFAGSSVVHMQGGVIALIFAWLIGPRHGKYDKTGKLVHPIAPHSIPMAMLGTFILVFGWFGFNPGSSLAGTELRIAVVAVNTMLASATGALGATLWMWWVKTKKPDPSMMCNGMLAGLVAITCPPVAAAFGPAQVTPRPAVTEREPLRSALESMAKKRLSESRRPNQNA